jgi:hypothetical protein
VKGSLNGLVADCIRGLRAKPTRLMGVSIMLTPFLGYNRKTLEVGVRDGSRTN